MIRSNSMLFKTAFNSITNLFFPCLCAGCGNDLFGQQKLLCLRCIDKLPFTNFHLYPNNPVEKIFWGRLPVMSAMSYVFFTKDSLLQQLLHQFKYKGYKKIGLYFGRKMGESFLESNRFKHIEALVPLPLYEKKERKRGYNQAAVLCDGIAEVMQLPVLKNVITRPMYTETQTHKSRIKRWQNIEGKFKLHNTSEIQNKHVLLIDDVITTGATLEACGQQLMQAKGVRLSIATMAYTTR